MTKVELPIVAALDEMTPAAALSLLQQVHDNPSYRIRGCKVTDMGDHERARELVAILRPYADIVWADMKLHDIPSTVAARLRVWVRAKATHVTVHASGGSDMLKAACDAAEGATLVAVTVLTSLTKTECEHIYGAPPMDVVRRLAELALSCGITHVVSSPLEVETLRAEFGEDIACITPGIRLPGEAAGTQRRFTTPGEAIKAGAKLLVMGSSLHGDLLQQLARTHADIRTHMEAEHE